MEKLISSPCFFLLHPARCFILFAFALIFFRTRCFWYNNWKFSKFRWLNFMYINIYSSWFNSIFQITNWKNSHFKKFKIINLLILKYSSSILLKIWYLPDVWMLQVVSTSCFIFSSLVVVVTDSEFEPTFTFCSCWEMIVVGDCCEEVVLGDKGLGFILWVVMTVLTMEGEEELNMLLMSSEWWCDKWWSSIWWSEGEILNIMSGCCKLSITWIEWLRPSLEQRALEEVITEVALLAFRLFIANSGNIESSKGFEGSIFGSVCIYPSRNKCNSQLL